MRSSEGLVIITPHGILIKKFISISAGYTRKTAPEKLMVKRLFAQVEKTTTAEEYKGFFDHKSAGQDRQQMMAENLSPNSA